MEGYIKIHRQILESSVFANANALKIWLWCLLRASYKPRFVSIKIGKGSSTIKIESGEFIFGRFSAEEDLCIDGSTIYKWVKKFQSEGMITLQSNSHYTRVSICKWDEYQQSEDIYVAANEQPIDSQVAANEQPRNTNKKVKNIKESKEYKKSLLSEVEPSDFPELNPEHVEIAKAFQTLFRANLTEAGTPTKTVDKAKGTAIDDVRLMLETDGYTTDDLRAVYRFLQVDSFWKQNILSTSTLREKMPKIKMKIHNQNGSNRTTRKEGTSWNELAAIIAGSGINA